MNTILISAAKLVLPGHQFHDQQIDVLIEEGYIAQIGQHLELDRKDVLVVDGAGATLAPGFFDLNVSIGEPGLETKEDIATGTAAAAAGGFTAIAVHPNTAPPIHSRVEVSLLVHAAKGNLVDVLPVGAISKKREGHELAELYDMQKHGAIAFCDGNHSVQQAGLMSRALLYAKGFQGLVISYAQDDSIAGGNQMNEGIMSTYLGMKGIPNLAESLMVSRDLFLAEYNEAPIHFTTISTAESVALIKQAKDKGLSVTCDVAAHHLVFTDEQVVGFDSQYKVSPPLRTKNDVQALIQGLEDGTIDAVVSQHTPHEIEFKAVEFHSAQPGIIGLQTVLPLLIQAGLSDAQIVQKLAINSRQIVHIPVPTFTVGEAANMVLFDRSQEWTFDTLTNQSKSANSPLMGATLTGKVLAVINNNQHVISNKN